MSEAANEQATDKEVAGVVHPETDPIKITITSIKDGSERKLSIVPLPRRWQTIWDESALPMYSAELAGPEAIIKSLKDGAFLFENLTLLMVNSQINADKKLDRVAAITLASQRTDVSSEALRKAPEKYIEEEIEWLQDHTRTDVLQQIADAQMKKEGALLRVGERCPAKFTWLLNLCGMTEMTPDSLKQLLTSLLSKSLPTFTGAGS